MAPGGKAVTVMSQTIRGIIITFVVGAAAAAAGYACTACGGGAQQTVVRQGPPAIACLPVFLPQIIADAQSHDAASALVHTAQLVECWVQHEPALPAPATAGGSAS